MSCRADKRSMYQGNSHQPHNLPDGRIRDVSHYDTVQELGFIVPLQTLHYCFFISGRTRKVVREMVLPVPI